MAGWQNPLPLVRLITKERTSETKSFAIIECLIMSVVFAVLVGYGLSLATESILLRAGLTGLAITYVVRSYVGYVTE